MQTLSKNQELFQRTMPHSFLCGFIRHQTTHMKHFCFLCLLLPKDIPILHHLETRNELTRLSRANLVQGSAHTGRQWSGLTASQLF